MKYREVYKMMIKQLEEAVKHVEDGDIETGLAIIRQLEKESNDEEKFYIGEQLYQWGFIEEAKNSFENLALIYPEEGEVLMMLAEIYIDCEDEEKAISVLENIHADNPVFVRSLLLLADLYQMQGLYEVSEQKLLEAKEIMQDEYIIDFALAELYLSIGDYQKSIPFYKEVMKTAEMVGNISINQRMAEVLTSIGEFEDALYFYDKALVEKFELNTLFGYGFTALHAGYPKTTIEKLTQLREIDPQYTSLYMYLAKAFELEGMLKECLQTIQAGIKADNFNKEILYYGGKIAVKMGKLNEAESFLREALALDPAYMDAIVALGNLLRSESKFHEIIELAEEVGKYGDIPVELEWDLGYAKNKLEFYEDAIKCYQLAYNSLKNNEDFLEEFGYILLEDGKRNEALNIFKELLKIEPTHLEISDLILQLEEQ